MRVKLSDLDQEQCAWAIEQFARWVENCPGVWAATIQDARYGKTSVNLHLIIHAELKDSSKPETKEVSA